MGCEIRHSVSFFYGEWSGTGAGTAKNSRAEVKLETFKSFSVSYPAVLFLISFLCSLV